MVTKPHAVGPNAARRSPIRSIGSGMELPVAFDVRTAFDFALSLSVEVGEQDELPAEDKAWLVKARADLGAPEAPLDDEGCVFGSGLLVDRPDVTDAAAYVELLRATTGRQFADLVLVDSRHDPEFGDDVAAALDGDREAEARILTKWPSEKHGWLTMLCRDPGALVEAIADRMAAWLPRYQEMEERIGRIIERDVALRADDRAALPLRELIEKTTNGIRWLSEPGVRRVVLAPSYLARPYNFTFTGADWRIFVYPVADAALEPHDPLAPPQSLLRLHRALGDETRLRILRLLRERDWYLTEIAERLELSKPTIKHHLAQLRAAGLTTLIEEGGLSYYSLRRERLDDASSELKRFLA